MSRYVVHVSFETSHPPYAMKIAQKLANLAAGSHGKVTEVMGPFVMEDGQANPILAYCDGGCSRRAGGWGYRIEHHDGTVVEACGGHADTTNNQMELTAMIECVKALPAGQRCIVYTDSKYVQQGYTQWLPRWLQRGWKTIEGGDVKNVEFWKRLIVVMGEKPFVEPRWVKGHVGNHGNERADVLAGQGMRPFMAAYVGLETETA